MTENTQTIDPNERRTNWAVSYDIPPIEIRDPVAETLGVLEPGEPFVVTYADVVKAAGHSCPTAAGAYRIAQHGLDALYPEDYPVRSDIAISAAGPRDDAAYGVTSRLLSYITGAAGEAGFGGLCGGYGGRQNLLTFDGFDADGPDPTFRFRRTDADETIQVTYHVGDVPDAGPAVGNLRKILDGDATREERQVFAEAWHGRVRAVLSDDDLFSVRTDVAE